MVMSGLWVVLRQKKVDGRFAQLAEDTNRFLRLTFLSQDQQLIYLGKKKK